MAVMGGAGMVNLPAGRRQAVMTWAAVVAAVAIELSWHVAAAGATAVSRFCFTGGAADAILGIRRAHNEHSGQQRPRRGSGGRSAGTAASTRDSARF